MSHGNSSTAFPHYVDVQDSPKVVCIVPGAPCPLFRLGASCPCAIASRCCFRDGSIGRLQSGTVSVSLKLSGLHRSARRLDARDEPLAFFDFPRRLSQLALSDLQGPLELSHGQFPGLECSPRSVLCRESVVLGAALAFQDV